MRRRSTYSGALFAAGVASAPTAAWVAWGLLNRPVSAVFFAAGFRHRHDERPHHQPDNRPDPGRASYSYPIATGTKPITYSTNHPAERTDPQRQRFRHADPRAGVYDFTLTAQNVFGTFDTAFELTVLHAAATQPHRWRRCRSPAESRIDGSRRYLHSRSHRRRGHNLSYTWISAIPLREAVHLSRTSCRRRNLQRGGWAWVSDGELQDSGGWGVAVNDSTPVDTVPFAVTKATIGLTSSS